MPRDDPKRSRVKSTHKRSKVPSSKKPAHTKHDTTGLLFCSRCGHAMNGRAGIEICPRCGQRQCDGCGDG